MRRPAAHPTISAGRMPALPGQREPGMPALPGEGQNQSENQPSGSSRFETEAKSATGISRVSPPRSRTRVHGCGTPAFAAVRRRLADGQHDVLHPRRGGVEDAGVVGGDEEMGCMAQSILPDAPPPECVSCRVFAETGLGQFRRAAYMSAIDRHPNVVSRDLRTGFFARNASTLRSRSAWSKRDASRLTS